MNGGKTMRILNLYAGIGGNRKLWGDEHEITAVENNDIIASVYKDFFPNDEVIVGDAKEYLLEHFKEFDFIWASPPCPTHSRMRTLWKGEGKLDNKTSGSSFKLPDMDLYSIIIFLKHFFEGDWIVENVISYYEPLINPQTIDNHYFWSNKTLQEVGKKTRDIMLQSTTKGEFDLSKYNLPFRLKRTMVNNCVRSYVGLKVLESFTKTEQKTLFKINVGE